MGAAIHRDSVPELAFQHALSYDQVAVSEAMLAELIDVLARLRLARFLDPGLRDDVLSRVHGFGIFFVPTEAVADCRDAKDNKYLELALAAGADTVVSNDNDLLVLHPWRGVRILLPAEYLAETEVQG